MNRLLCLLAVCLLAAPAASQDLGLAIRAGTFGPGIDLSYSVTPKVSVRLSGSYLPLSGEETFEDDLVNLLVGAEVTTGGVGIQADYHPFSNMLRLTGGLYLNLVEVTGSGTPASSYCFGEETGGTCNGEIYTPEELGLLEVTASYPSPVSPYVGIGLGRISGAESRVGFLFDAGVLYTGAPEFSLSGSGLIGPTASEENAAILNTGAESFQFYPMVSIGLAIRL